MAGDLTTGYVLCAWGPPSGAHPKDRVLEPPIRRPFLFAWFDMPPVHMGQVEYNANAQYRYIVAKCHAEKLRFCHKTSLAGPGYNNARD